MVNVPAPVFSKSPLPWMELLIEAVLPMVSTIACLPEAMLTRPVPEMVVPAATAPSVPPLKLSRASVVPSVTLLTAAVPPLRLKIEPALPAPPTVTPPLTRLPLLTVSTLPVAAPRPMVTLPPPRFHVLAASVMVLLLEALPIMLVPVVENCTPLVSTRLLPLAPLALRTNAPLVRLPLLRVSTLPVAAPLPMVTLPPPRFQMPADATVTLLFEDPLPITLAPVLNNLPPLLTVTLAPPAPAGPTVRFRLLQTEPASLTTEVDEPASKALPLVRRLPPYIYRPP